jgi:hypothetical protein
MSENDVPCTNHESQAAAVNPVVREVRSDIERSLRTRHLGHGKVLYEVEDRAKTLGARAWERLKNRP